MVQLRLIDATDSPNVQDWTASTAVRALEVRAQGGVLYRRKAAGTTRSTFDATEAGFWDAFGGTGGTGGVPADGSITVAKLAFNPATQAELDAFAATLPTSYAPLASPAFTGTPTVNGSPIGAGGGSPTQTVSPVLYVSPTGSDSNSGLTEASPKGTLQAAVTSLRSSPGYGVVHLMPGVHALTSSLTVYQGISIVGPGFGSMGGAAGASGGAEIIWSGPDSGYAMVTAASTTADWTWGVLRGVRLRCADWADAPTNSVRYATVGGLYLRNMQNLSHVEDFHVTAFPGRGIYADDAQSSATNTMPGAIGFTRVWATGNGINWHIRAGYTGNKWELCKADAANPAAPIQTTDCFIIDPPLGSSAGRGGKDGVFVFDAMSMEMQTPDANMMVVNTDIGLVLDGCSFTRPTPGTKAAIHYNAAPGSTNVTAGTIPVEITQAHLANIPSLLRAPSITPAVDLVIANPSGGETASMSWSGQRTAPKWDGTHTGFAADRVDLNGTAAASTLLKGVAAPGQTAPLAQFDGPVFTDIIARADSTTTAGPGWSKLGGAGGAAGVSSGRIYAVAPAAGNDVTVVFDDASADGTYVGTFTLSAAAGRYNVSQVFRAIDQNNYIRATLVNNQLVLAKNLAGANTTLASAAKTLVASTSYVMKTVLSGASIKVYVDGTKLLDYTLTSGEQATFLTPTLKGVRFSTGTSGTTDDGGSRYGPVYTSATVVQITAAGSVQRRVAGVMTDLALTGSGSVPFDNRYQYAQPATGLEVQTGTPLGLTTGAVTAGVLYLVKLHLTAGVRTTVEQHLSAAGAGLTNTFLGVYDATSLSLLASSADVSTTYQSTGQKIATLSYTASAEQDIWLGWMCGAATTAPTFITHATGNSVMAIVRGTAQRHSTTGLTALPSTLTLQTTGGANGILAPWTAYR